MSVILRRGAKFMKKCSACGAKDVEFHGRSSVCKKCEYKKNSELRRKRYAENPILHKANNVSSRLKWGRGSQERMIKLIEKYLGEKCKYCGVELTLDNMSLDHKIPLPHCLSKPSKRTKNSKMYAEYTPEKIKELNSEENLHFICLKCNRRKGNLTDEEYSELIKFLEKYPHMKEIVLAKLGMSNFGFR